MWLLPDISGATLLDKSGSYNNLAVESSRVPEVEDKIKVEQPGRD
jgi:hypothetical protein